MLYREFYQALVGRIIVNAELNQFATGRGTFTCDPVIILDNGVRLSFDVTQTDALNPRTQLPFGLHPVLENTNGK